MMRALLPLILAAVGLGAGIGAGLLLRPGAKSEYLTAHDATSAHAGDSTAAAADSQHVTEPGSGPEYVKLNNQFVVPVVEQGRVNAMVVLSLSLEMEPGNSETVYDREPKLRDVFLQVLFDHANVGGFSGSFTDGSNLLVLRNSLKEAAAMILGTTVRDILITEIARQDS